MKRRSRPLPGGRTRGPGARELRERRAVQAHARDLQEIAQQYQALFEQHPQPMSIYCPQTLRFLAVNAAALARSGYTRQEFLQLSVPDMVPPEDRPAFRRELLLHPPRGARHTRGRHCAKDGEVIHVAVFSTDIVFQGRTARLVASVDITEERQAAQALRSSEERFRALTQLSSDWFWEQDEQFRFTHVSAEGGWPRELPPSAFMLGKALWELPGTEMDDWAAHRAQLQRHEPFRDVELRRRGSDGQMRYAEVSGAPVFDAKGRFVGYRGVGRDVTERRRQEKLLRMQHQVARCLAGTDEAREAIRCVLRCVCEAEDWDYGRCWLADDAAGVLRCRVSWRRPGSAVAEDAARSEGVVYQRGSGMVGRVWDSGQPLWVPDLHQGAGVQKLLTPGAALHGVCIFPITAGGRVLGAMSFLTEAVRSADGKLLDTLQAIGSQLGQFLQRKQREEEIAGLNAQLENRVRERTAQLQEANVELEAFAYSIAHDLRSPLTSIDGFSHLLAACSGPPGPRERHALARIRAGVRHMNELTEAMLTLARLSRGEIHREPVDLTRLARDAFAALREREPDRQAQLHAPQQLWASGDPLLLGQVVANLIDNAWKFSGRKPRTCIRMGAQAQHGETVFWVADEGAGFDMAYADRLFGAFQRLHGAQEFEGTGVGLAVVQKIVARHGGRIWAHAAVDQGASFHFTLGMGHGAGAG